LCVLRSSSSSWFSRARGRSACGFTGRETTFHQHFDGEGFDEWGVEEGRRAGIVGSCRSSGSSSTSSGGGGGGWVWSEGGFELNVEPVAYQEAP
jgi:hypothetical protein